ncbi:MAG: selenocysteine-specific translation elongation factor [bacterium]
MAPRPADRDAGSPSRGDDAGPGIVLGTAGHIDHGKTALVRALTGRDLDRLPEEKARGITIELGFAPLSLASDVAPPAALRPPRIALVDVPGHERFVRTMVAGASGLDLVMLVVAADEGVMPQTREHWAVCELLGIERGLVVLSKVDLVDEEMLELAREEVRDLLAGGPMAEAPIVAASAKTGAGIESVRETLRALVASGPAPGEDRRPARLFVDRCFVQRGFGAVVTGTWSGRPRRTGDAMVLEPGARKARIRGLERHGDAIAVAVAGARIAVNLQGPGHDEIHRGDLLSEPDALAPTRTFDARIRWLARRAPLEAPTSVELLTGTAERRARVAPIGEAPIEPGEQGFARLHVEGPALGLLPGDRFVLRGFARDAGIGATLGGGLVLDVAPPHRRRRDPALRRELERLEQAGPAEAVTLRIERAGLEGARTPALARETGLDADALREAIETSVAQRTVVRLDRSLCLSTASVERLMGSLIASVERFHASQPLQVGMPRAGLAGALPENVAPEAAAALLALLAERGELVVRGESVARPGFEPTLDPEESRLAGTLAARLERDGLEPPSLRALAEELAEEPARLRTLAHHLERQGGLIAARDDLFFDRAAVDALIERVVAWFDDHDELDTQTLKALVGATRRTAMPLMALLDDLQITRRDGSLRRLLHRTPRRSGESDGADGADGADGTDESDRAG